MIELEKKLWSAADELRANSELKSSEYSVPVLGLIFLKYSGVRFAQAKKELEGMGSSRRTIGKSDYHASGVIYLPEVVRFSYLPHLPEGKDTGKEINEAFGLIEQENPELKVVLLKSYQKVFKQIHVLAKNNQKHSQTCALLLPKLISGEVYVAEMNIEMKEAAA